MLMSDFTAGYWNIIVHGRKHSYRLYTKMLNEAMRWVSAIQGVIDNKVPIETPTQQLIRDIKVIVFKNFSLVFALPVRMSKTVVY